MHIAPRCLGLSLLMFASPLLVACTDAPSMLDPHGPRAERLAIVSWLIFGLGAAVFIAVMALLAVALLRGRRERPPATRPGDGHRFILVGGIAVPAIILVGLMALTVDTGRVLSDPDEPEALTVEVIGWQFWWEVRYPGQNIVTANQINIPAGRPVRLRLTAVDVIHSFWVPQLSGKTDLIPGQTNTLWIEAHQPGTYRGQCAEFCGIQHAKMAFHVVAQPPNQFQAWLETMRRPAASPVEPNAQRGLELFFRNACASCHAIRGATSTADAGPDLTHLMQRQWIAAGTLRNTRENLAAFITRAQEIKRGSSMPSYSELNEQDLAALLALLQSLE